VLGVGSLLVALADGALLLLGVLDWVWVTVTVAVGLDEEVLALAEPEVAGVVVLGVADVVVLWSKVVPPVPCEPLTVADNGLPDSSSKPVTAAIVTTNSAPAATASWRGLIAGRRTAFAMAALCGSDAVE
jgi:hypothetical protein